MFFNSIIKKIIVGAIMMFNSAYVFAALPEVNPLTVNLPQGYSYRIFLETGRAYIEDTNRLNPLYKRFLSMYKKAINNKTSAAKLIVSNISDVIGELSENELCRYWDWPLYLYRSYIPPVIEDLTDIQNGKALLRVNKKASVVYTVKKAGEWYIFRTYAVGGSKTDVSVRIISEWWIKKIPDIEFFRTIKRGITTSEDILRHDQNAGLFISETDKKWHTKHVFADEHSTVIDITYQEGEAGKFYADDVKWIMDGLNPLPYLLPIDLELIT